LALKFGGPGDQCCHVQLAAVALLIGFFADKSPWLLLTLWLVYAFHGFPRTPAR